MRSVVGIVVWRVLALFLFLQTPAVIPLPTSRLQDLVGMSVAVGAFLFLWAAAPWVLLRRKRK